MERLWAPWRMGYITADKPAGCVFCIGNGRGGDRERLVLHRSERSYVIMNRYPYSNGHLMVIPYRHISSLDDLGDGELLDLMKTLRLARRAIESVLSPQGFNIGMNLGHAAGAGVDDHIHFHIVPRWQGDTNYMTVTADIRVIPEAMAATFSKLQPFFVRHEAGVPQESAFRGEGA